MPRKKIVQNDIAEPMMIEEKVEKTTEDILMEQIEMLKKQLLELASKKAEPQMIVEEVEEEDDEIKNTEYIKIVNLYPSALNLSTMGNGQGKVFKFAKFGEVKRVLYSDLVDIMESNHSFLEAGFFYIMDTRVIRRHGLDDLYATLVDKAKIEQIIAGKGDVIALYKGVNDKQKSILVDILIQKVREDEESIDMNIVSHISRLSNVDIIQKAKEGKEFEEILKG